MQIVEVLQGDKLTEVEFPDDMSPEAIEEVLRQEFPPASEQMFSADTPLLSSSASPVEDQSIFRSFADVPLKIGSGLAIGAKGIAEAFGADSAVAENIEGIEGFLDSLLSAQSKADSAEISRLQQEAQDKGFLDQAIAALKGISAAPIDFTAQTIGTALPIIAGTAAATFAGAPASVVTALGVGAGSLMGTGIVKGAIFDVVEEELLKANVSPEEAEAVAQEAQSYKGGNLDQIGLGAILGAWAARSGLEPAIGRLISGNIARRGILKGAAIGATAEAFPEGLQGAQEQLARNLAQIREAGIDDVPLYRGVAGAGTLEGLAGGIGGGVFGAASSGATEEQPGVIPTDDLSEITETTGEPEPAPQISEDTLRTQTLEKLDLIAPNLRGTLKGRGLDDIGLKLSYSLENLGGMARPEEIDALYDPDVKTIFLGADRIKGFADMDAPQLQREFGGLVDHEMVHAVKRMNLWKDSEWRVLENAARKNFNSEGATYLQTAQERYSTDTAEIQSEEAIAELIRDTLAGRTKLAGQPLNLMQRLLEFFRKMGNSLTGTGYASFNQVVNDIDTGALGARPRGGRQATPVGTSIIGGSPALASRKIGYLPSADPLTILRSEGNIEVDGTDSLSTFFAKKAGYNNAAEYNAALRAEQEAYDKYADDPVAVKDALVKGEDPFGEKDEYELREAALFLLSRKWEVSPLRDPKGYKSLKEIIVGTKRRQEPFQGVYDNVLSTDMTKDEVIAELDEAFNLGSTEERAIRQGLSVVSSADQTPLASRRALGKDGSPMGINVRQDPDGTDYASLIASGQKTYETRETRSLDPYVGKRVDLVRTGAGPASVVGSAEVGTPIEVDENQFANMRSDHLVAEGSAFDIKRGKTKFLYPMTNAESTEPTVLPSDYRGIIARKTGEPLASRRVKSNIQAQQVMNLEGMTGEQVAAEELRLAEQTTRQEQAAVGLAETRRILDSTEEPLASRRTTEEPLASRGRLPDAAQQQADKRTGKASSKVKIEDIATALDENHLSVYGRKLDPTVTEDQLLAADVIAQDIKQQMTNDVSGKGWYDADVEKTFMLLSQIPGLESLATNEDHRVIWSALAAPTSIGQKVSNNTRAATAAMLGYLRTGKVPTTPPAANSVTEGIPKAGWGFKQKSVGSGMKVISTLVDKYGEAGFSDWWLSPHPLSELTAIRKEAGLSGAPAGLSGGKDSIHLGAMSIGDKTGRFSLNINGYEGTTKDVWYSRSYNRAFGQMFGNTGEVQGGPRNQTERRQMELFNRLVLDEIKQEGLSEADAQAILWFHEQNLYTELGVISRAESFSQGVEALYENFGIRQAVRGSDEGQARIEPTNALENFRGISPEERIERDQSRQETTKLKTKPEDSAALAADKSKALNENNEDLESDQAASEQLTTVKKLASRNNASDIVESTAYNRVADISSKRASRGQGNINNALPFEAPSSADDRGIVYQIQDKYIDLKNSIEAIKKNQRDRGLTPLIDTENPYLGEESMHGIIGNKFNRFQEDEIVPLAKKLVARNISRKEFEEFLVLRHSIERNENVRKINAKSKQPRADLADGGAGSLNGQRLLDSYVKNEMQSKYGLRWNDSTQSWEGGNQKASVLNDLSADFDSITRGTLQELKNSGLINQDSLNKLNSHYKYYAPLRGLSPDEDIAIEERARKTGRSNNLSISGIETEKAKGRVSEATPPLGQIMMQRQSAIKRGTINDVVGQRILNVIRENPNDSYWKIHEERGDAGSGAGELFGVKEDGKQLFVEFKDARLRDAMLSLDADQSGKLVGFLRGVNRYYSAVMTQYNPEFVVGNFARDVGTAMGNLVGEQTMVGGKAIDTKGLKGAVIADVLPSVRQVYRGLRGKDLKGDLARDWKEYLESGAKTEWFYAKSPEESSADVDKLIEMAKGTFKGNMRSGKDAIAGFVSDTNSAVENGVRFATFKKARDLFIKNGVPRDLALAQAATLAKNLTVNFNRKGNSGELLNGLYLFFNASVQGTANFVRGMSSPAKQRMLGAMVSFGALVTLLNEEGSEEDDKGESYYSQIDPWRKERNLIFMKTLNPFYTGPPNAAYTIPLPYGYNVLHLLGVNAVEVGMGLESPQVAAGEMVSAALGSFAPVGFGTSRNPATFVLKGAVPQIGKPLTEILLNEDFFGSPIYTENFSFGDQVPLSYLSQRSTPEVFKQTTKFLNELTGGDESMGGKYVDLSWISPDALDYLVGTQIGGLGSFVKRSVKSAEALADYAKGEYREDDISVNDIPFIRRGMFEVTGRKSQSDYYDRRDDILAYDRQAKLLRGSERGDYIRKNRPYLLMNRTMESTDKRLRNINKQLRAVGDMILSSSSIEQTIKLEERQKSLEDMKQSAYDRFNKRFNEKVGRTK